MSCVVVAVSRLGINHVVDESTNKKHDWSADRGAKTDDVVSTRRKLKK
jgi:hypothetical protein